MKLKTFIRQNIANFITVLRIVFSLTFFFLEFKSGIFFIFYSLAGFTDAIDGFVARKTNTISKFGSRLDSISDLVFFVCIALKMILNLTISWRIYVIIAITSLLKTYTLIIGYRHTGEFFACHNIINKVQGLIFFLMPFTLLFINDPDVAVMFPCAFALFAATVEYMEVNKRKGEIIE